MSNKKKNRLNDFIRDNAFQILSFIIFVILFYSSTNYRLDTHAEAIGDVETNIDLIIQNQKDIISLQKDTESSFSDITEIKQSLRDIKNAMGLL